LPRKESVNAVHYVKMLQKLQQCTSWQAPKKIHNSSIYWCMPSHCTPNTEENWEVWLIDAPPPPPLPTVQTRPHQISTCFRTSSDHEGPTLRKWCNPGEQYIQACAVLTEMPGLFWGFCEIVTDISSKSRWYLLLDKNLCVNIKYTCSRLSVQPIVTCISDRRRSDW
jgi:hypothetical protein